MCSLRLAARLPQNFYFNADCNSSHNKVIYKHFVKIVVKRFFHLQKNCFKKAVEAFKVWASKGNTAGKKFSKCVLRAKRSQKRVKIVSEWKHKLFRTFWKKLFLGDFWRILWGFFRFFFYVFLFMFFAYFFLWKITSVLKVDEAASPQRPKGRSQLNPSRFTKLFKTMPKWF